MLVAGATNVAELVLAKSELDGGASGFALLVAAFGCGMLAGSLLAPRRDEALRSRYLTAIAALGAGLLATAAAPTLPTAMIAFASPASATASSRDRPRPDAEADPRARPRPRLGVLDAIDSWGFGAAILAGGALAASVGAA